jgi:superfamily II DNA or RNA helicase
MPIFTPRAWQIEAMKRWIAARHRGIISVVTGGGKTIFALSCIAQLRPDTTLIVVPTAALLEQWWEEAAFYFSIALEEIHIVRSSGRLKTGSINIAVINTASQLPTSGRWGKLFLIVDECHKAASDSFRKVLEIEASASLGLSATPERPYDNGLEDVLIPALGPVIFTYDYAAALEEGVIVPFTLNNIVFELEEDRQAEYDKLTKAIARSMQQEGPDSERTIALMLKRARVLNLSMNRVKIALKLVSMSRTKRTLIFHEDIQACEIIASVLEKSGVPSRIYHSKMAVKARAEALKSYRSGQAEVLVTCRSLDEGFNVPETQLGIIAASTATRRQRIQRLGRIVRPAPEKHTANIYTLVATGPEIQRLKEEETLLEGVASICWSKA